MSANHAEASDLQGVGGRMEYVTCEGSKERTAMVKLKSTDMHCDAIENIASETCGVLENTLHPTVGA